MAEIKFEIEKEPVDYELRIKECEKMEQMEKERREKSDHPQQWVSKQEYFQEELLAIRNDINIDQELELLELLCENVGDPKSLIWSFIFNERMTHAIKTTQFWRLWNTYFDAKSTAYMLRYTMYIMLFEEWVRCVDIDVSCRNMWTLEEAHLLSNNMTSVSKDSLTHPFIFIADPFFSNLSYYMGSNGRSFVDMETFRTRLSYMVPFIDINLQKYNMCLSGSALLPCISNVPHQSMFNTWEEFADYYYPKDKSDIDLSIHQYLQYQCNRMYLDHKYSSQTYIYYQ